MIESKKKNYISIQNRQPAIIFILYSHRKINDAIL